MPRSTLSPRRRPLILIALAAVLLGAVFALSPQAHAQGTNGMLPDPIADHDLSAYARRLGLSEQQRLAIDAFHAQYLEEFRRLRQEQIDPYLQESANILGRIMLSADSKEAKSSLNELNRLISRIRSLDEGLFNQIQTVLSEEQAEIMPSVRQMRQRQRSRAGLVRFVGFANPGARIDLAEYIETMELAPPEGEAIRPLLMEYEAQLTGALRSLYQATTNMYLNMIEQIEKLNATATGRGDPRRQFGERLRQVWTEASADVMAEASKISALNRRFFRRFATLLSEDAADRLQGEYYRQAYPDVYRGTVECLGRYDAALRLPDLSQEQHTAIDAARQALRDRHQRLADQMIDAWEALRKTQTFFGGRSRSDNPDQERLRRLQAERDELNERALESLLALLGPDLAERLHQAQAEESDADETVTRMGSAGATVTRRGGGGGPRSWTTSPAGGAPAEPEALRGADPYLPPPISEREAQRFAEVLEFGDDQRIVLDVLHGDYLDAYEALRERLIEPILDLRETMWSLDPESEEIRPPSADVIDELFTMRRAAFAEIRDLDESFFDNVRLALVDDDDESHGAKLTRLRLSRQRLAYNREAARSGTGFRRQGNRMFFGRSSPDHFEYRIDLTAIIEGQYLSDEDLAALESVLVEYERAAVDAFKQRYELSFQYGQATERLSAAAAGQARGPGRGMDRSVGDEFRRLMETVGRQLREAETAIAQLNRRTLQRLADLLSDSAAATVRSAYRREAFPQVYEDPTAVEGRFAAALALPDLTGAQRAQVNETLVEYRSAYVALCEQMADLQAEDAREADPTNARDPGYWQRRQERRTQMERLRFDRNDLNEKALRQLRASLSEDQLQRLGLVEGQ